MAIDFSGTGQYLSRASTPITAVPITMACWFNSDSVALTQNLIGIDDGTATNLFRLQAAGSVAGDPIRFQTSDGSGAVTATTSTAYSASVWNHAAGVSSGVASRAAYLNGAGKGTNTSSRTPTGLVNTTIGSSPAGTNLTDGRIAEAAIWNVALSDAEIAALATGISPRLVRPDALVCYWPGVRDLLIDAKGAPFTATGSPTVSNHCRIIPPSRRAVRRLAAASSNVPTNITLGQASWAWAGGAPGINAKTAIALGQAAWAWAGRTPGVDARTQIALGQAAWAWNGRTMPNFGSGGGVQSLLPLVGCG